MNLKQRIKKVETVILAAKAKDELYPITLSQWRRYAKGFDILPEIPERRRAAFLEWREKADERMKQAAETLSKFAD